LSSENNYIEWVGKRVEELRKSNKITREQLEEDCDLPSNCIRQIERGPRKTLDIGVLCNLAEYFDVDPEYLLGVQDCKRRDVADASNVTGLSYEAVEALKSIDHLHNIDIFHALSAFICSPSFVPLLVHIRNFCTPCDEKIPRFNISVSEITNASIQKYVAQSLEEARKQCEKKMGWYQEVLPIVRALAGKLSDEEKKEGKRYSDERIEKEVLKPIGLDTEGKKLFMTFLNYYRTNKGKVEE